MMAKMGEGHTPFRVAMIGTLGKRLVERPKRKRADNFSSDVRGLGVVADRVRGELRSLQSWA